MMQCFMKKEDKSLIDVENVETTYFDNCAFFAALASFLLVLFHSSVLLLPHSSSRLCSLYYPVGVIRLSIVTTLRAD